LGQDQDLPKPVYFIFISIVTNYHLIHYYGGGKAKDGSERRIWCGGVDRMPLGYQQVPQEDGRLRWQRCAMVRECVQSHQGKGGGNHECRMNLYKHAENIFIKC
jgi:hypothetical protein